jgi:hypothetical protein
MCKAITTDAAVDRINNAVLQARESAILRGFFGKSNFSYIMIYFNRKKSLFLSDPRKIKASIIIVYLLTARSLLKLQLTLT